MPTDAVFIRSAGERDLAAVQALLVETWHDAYDRIYGRERVAEITAEWHSIPSLEARLKRPRSEFLLADDGSSLAGMAYAAQTKEACQVVLHQLYVRPAFQGRGVGAALLAEIEGSFPEARSLRLEVEKQNENAVRFYRNHGFGEVREGAPGDCASAGMPALAMEKKLG
ncbi:MAG TPA: GNAT family N-acetyltransferase [Mesorhizobium sp.]|nr:GNAT family N-acetyltransferase [Mesorhizobium sp.]